MRTAFAFVCLATAAVTALLSAIDTRAAVRDWNAASGDWYDSGNWNPNGTPAASDTLNIASGTATLTTGPDLTINGGGSINLSGTGVIDRSTTHWTRFGEGSAGTYTQTGGTFTSNSGRFYMGRIGGDFTADISGGTFSYVNGSDFIVGNDTAVGTLNVSGGTFNVTTGNFRLGVDNSGAGEGNLSISGGADVNLYWLSIAQGAAGSTGHVTMSGGTLDTTRDLRVGINGTGTFTQSGGTVTSATYFLVGQDGGTGTYNLDGGLLQVNGYDTHIARGGTGSSGTFTQTDGQFHNNGWLNVGALNGGTGEYTITGGELTTSTLAVGREGYGTMTIGQAAGKTTTVTTNTFHLGYYAAAAGSMMEVTGGTLNINSTSYIGREAQVTFTQTGGTVNGPNADLFVGSGASDATLNIEGGLFSQTGGNFRVGVDNSGSGQGTVNLTGGDADLYWLSIAQGGANSVGHMTVSGGTLDITRGFRVGLGGAGTYTQNGGTVTAIGGDDHFLGQGTGSAVVTINGGTLTHTSGNTRLGVDTTGTLSINGGDVNFYYLSIAQGGASSQGHVVMTGGTLDTTRDLRVGINGTGTFTQSGGTVTSAAYFLVGQDSGTGTYNLDGGVLQVNGYDTYFARGGTGSSGTFTQTDGQFHNNGWLNVGALNGGTGEYTITGGEVTTGTLAVGREGYGTMTIGQAAGKTTTVTTNGFYLGYDAAAAGSTMEVTGGTLNINSASYIGREAQVTFTQTGGTVNGPNADLFVGYGAADATLNIDGGLFSQTGGNFRVGVDNTGAGQGTVNITGGDVDLYYLSIAQGNANSVGHMTVSGGTLDITQCFRVGLGGTGTYTQDGGTVTASGAGDHFLGQGSGSAVVTINDGTLTHTGGNTRLGVDTTSTLNINGGDVNFNWLSMAQGGASSEGHVVMTGGTLDVNQRIRVGTSSGATGTFLQTGGVVGGTNLRPVWIGEGGATGTYTLRGGALNASVLTDAGTGTSTLKIQGGLGTIHVTDNAAGAFSFAHANSLLNPEVGSTGLTTVDLAGPAATAILGGSLDVDVYGGAMFNPSDTFDLVTASNITGAASMTVVDDEGLWNTNKDTASTALTLWLAPALEQGQVTIDQPVINVPDLQAGWFDVLKGANPRDDFNLVLTLSGDGSEADLAAWMTLAGLDATGDDAADTLTLWGLEAPTGPQSYFAWDFTDYNVLSGTSLAVTGAFAFAVPEPSTLLLLALGSAGFLLWRRRRKR